MSLNKIPICKGGGLFNLAGLICIFTHDLEKPPSSFINTSKTSKENLLLYSYGFRFCRRKCYFIQ